MKLKMHQNSLFAILLRTRWWISFVVAGVIFLVSGALLPSDLVAFGMLAAVPFVVIGVIAVIRQRNSMSPEQAEALLSAASTASWPAFNAQLVQAWRAQGYRVSEAQATGYDLVLEGHGQTVLVAARRWKAARLGIDTLRALHTAYQGSEANAACVVALAEPSEQAMEFAKSHGLEVVHGTTLAQLLYSGRPRKS